MKNTPPTDFDKKILQDIDAYDNPVEVAYSEVELLEMIKSAVSELVEECIGEDEKEPTYKHIDEVDMADCSSERNELRAEIRQRFKEALK